MPIDSKFVPAAESVLPFTFGYDNLVADYFWLQFILQVGSSDLRLDVADQYLELITRLDPHFLQAYWFAAFVVGGECGSPTRAAEIIDYGIEQNPDSWYLPFIAGVNQYLYARNEALAAKYYRKAAKYSDAPKWLERQATILESKLPRLIKEAQSWLNIYYSTGEKAVKQHAKERCVWLWVQVYRDAPNDAYRQKAKIALASLDVDVNMFAKLKK